MNVITLNNEQLAHVRSTLQKQANDLMGDMNAAGQSNWSDLLTDLANDQYQLIQSIIAELDDCQTPKVLPKVVIPPRHTENLLDGYYKIGVVAQALNIDPKTFYNRKDTGKFEDGVHYIKNGTRYLWHLEGVRDYFRSENSH